VRCGRRRFPTCGAISAWCFQGQKLLFDRSVFDNVMLPLVVTGQPYREARRRARAALDKVGLLQREKANPVALRRRAAALCVARAVVNRPAILLADEPHRQSGRRLRG